MKDLSNASAVAVEVDAGSEGQRVDNFLLRVCKGVPRSHIYRVLRTGEVRVNSRRVGATYRLQLGDRVRIPPIRVAPATPRRAPPVELPIVFEDDSLLVVDKPSGIAVHGGSGVSFGVIERLRSARPQARFLELAHRLDRETSGLLMLAKRRTALVALHAALRDGRVRKRYLVLVKGRWRDAERSVDLPLRKSISASGERRVSVDRSGREALTVFRRVREVPGYTLLEAELKTGRTHQIRVHLAHLGFPIAGDDKYGDFELNRALAKRGLKRMFLHAAELELAHPVTGAALSLTSPLPRELHLFLDSVQREVQ
ncbi:MAG TPA: RluA family pseudouridine synthase [Burkholderiales bacterium]